MKKQLTFMLFLSGFSMSAFAQGVYFKAGGGYAIPVASQVIGIKHIHREDYRGNNNVDEYKDESVSGSFGAGANFLIGGGYMFTENLGIELNVQYTQGKKFETGDTYTQKTDNSQVTGIDNDLVQNFSNTFYFNPSFVVTTGAGTKSPYGRFGVIAGLPKVNEEESRYYNLDGISTGSTKWESTGGLAIGFQGAVGMNWMLNDKIDLFTEINFISMTYYAEKRTMTEDKSDGYDNLPNYSVAYKETIYKKSIDPYRQTDSTKPTEALREARAFSSVSLQVGISFLLNGHGEN